MKTTPLFLLCIISMALASQKSDIRKNDMDSLVISLLNLDQTNNSNQTRSSKQTCILDCYGSIMKKFPVTTIRSIDTAQPLLSIRGIIPKSKSKYYLRPGRERVTNVDIENHILDFVQKNVDLRSITSEVRTSQQTVQRTLREMLRPYHFQGVQAIE